MLISFSNMAVKWFKEGTDEVRRLIVKTIGSNFRLRSKILSIEAAKPFVVRGSVSYILGRCGFIDDVRTMVANRDESLMQILANIKRIQELVDRQHPPSN
jgi:hypothetical protein